MTGKVRELMPVVSRRSWLGRAGGLLAAASLSRLGAFASGGFTSTVQARQNAPRARHVIFLFMSGGPSHVDLFDPKPELVRRHGQPIPDSYLDGVHFAMIPSNGTRPRLYGSPYSFARHGDAGVEMSELLPHLGEVADRLTVVKSVRSTVFNHDPAVNLVNTGDARVGRPTLGSWVSYGLGSPAEDLPSFLVLTSGVKRQPLLTSYWSSGFLPTEHQGVELRNAGDPILFLSNPAAVTRGQRRRQLDLIRRMNESRYQLSGDPEIQARVKQYELAFRMQVQAPELMDLRGETAATLKEYGVDAEQPSFGRNCLLARRMVESGVRFVQLYDMGWDSHNNLDKEHRRQCRAIDKPIAALLRDLARRGLLDDTLVIWGGEFGRTPVAQGEGESWGRDHHPHGFTMWMAGGGTRPGTVYGKTDEFGFHAVDSRLDIHDLHATVLHLLGVDHEQLTYRYQGRDFRLTDVGGHVIPDLLA